MYFAIPYNAWSFWLVLQQILIRMKSYCLYIFLTVSHNCGFVWWNSDIYWNRLIGKKKQMAFRSMCYQVVETEPFKHFFCSYFKVMHDFNKCRSTFVRSGIISKVCKVRTIVLKKQSHRSVLNSKSSNIDPRCTP